MVGRVVGVILAIAWLFAACVGQVVESSTTAVVADTSPSTAATAPPTSREVATTTAAPTTEAPPIEPIWIATYRRDFPGYAVELIEIHNDDRVVIPANRFEPFPQAVFSDGSGGIVTGSPLAHLAAGSVHPSVILDTSVDRVVMIDGVPTALYTTTDGESGWDDLIMWDDVTMSLLAQPLGGEPETVLTAHSASRIAYPTMQGDFGEPRPGRSAYGGGVLAVVWTDRLASCSWLELLAGPSTEPAPVVNPWPQTACDDDAVGVIDVAVTADGRALVAIVAETGRGPSLVAWDLITGAEIDTVPDVLLLVHDGDRHFAVERRTPGYGYETALVELTADGIEVTALPGIAGPIGILTGELRVLPEASLAPATSWTTCSTAGRTRPAAQGGLPGAVAATRDAIAAAVIECDLVALADLAAVSPDFRMVDAVSYCDEPWAMSMEDDDVVHHWYGGDNRANELTTLLNTLEAPPIIEDDRFVWIGEYDYRIEIHSAGDWVRNQRGFPPPECEGMECTC